MSEATARTLFSATCLAGVAIIVVAALMEILRQKRGESLLRAGQFRLRIFSALVWVILLGSLAYAVAFLWPHGRDPIMMKKFAAVIGGSLSLLMIALFLLAYDVWQIGQQRRSSERKFNRNLEVMAREEIEKVRLEKQQQSTTSTQILSTEIASHQMPEKPDQETDRLS